MPKSKTKISLKQREKMLLTPCKTREEFMKWVRYHFKFWLPDQTVSRYADTNPFDAAWEIYDICVNKNNPEKVEELLYVAARGSGKTLGCAIAELAVMLHDKRSVVHVGAIMSQAKRCYAYQQTFMLNDKLKPVLNANKPDPDSPGEFYRTLDKMNMEESIFNLKKRDGTLGKTTLEILPCTLKAVNGPHVPLVVVDEIDTVSGEGFRAFKDIEGMLDGRDGQDTLRVGISTRKSRYGLMNAQIEEAEEAGRTVRRWTALEFARRCPDDRSGTTPTVGYYNQDDMVTITEEMYESKDKAGKNLYQRNEFPGEGCIKCPIAPLCLGDAKKQKSESWMLKDISEPIKKARGNGPDWAISQLFNLKPSVEGIIYKEFEERLHVKNWNQMWKILTGKEYPGECDHDTFVKKCHNMNLTCYAGIDWGWTNPSTVVYFFVDRKDNIYVVRCEGITQTNNPTWVQMIKKKWHNIYKCQLYFPDPGNPGDLMTMRQEGLPCPTKIEKDVESGIQVVKKFLRSLASPVPKMYFAKETCQDIVIEFQTYHFKTDAAGKITEDPEKEYDHWLDALRYALYNLYGKSTFVTSNAGVEYNTKVIDQSGNFLRSPSAEEFAYARGIQVNSDDLDTSKLGKIGTLSELEDDEDGLSGDGSFLWSF